MQNISNEIRAVCAKKGIKLYQVAYMIGIGEQTLYNKMYSGNMTIKSLLEIADALNCEIVFKERE